MYQLDNFALFAAEKDHLTHITKWANDSLFNGINTKKHKISIKTMDVLLSQIPTTTQLMIISMNKDILGFCEIYSMDIHNRSCYINVYLENESENFVLHGYKVLGMICKYLYNISGMNKVSTEALLEDSLTVSVFKQRGFKTEVHKRAHVLQNGSRRTLTELALLSSEADI
jgi:hypothetical protein